MDRDEIGTTPTQCPVCAGPLLVTRLECSSCGTEVNGTFALGHLASLREPHASLIEMFLRVRGNVKEMERELGLSYPTVRARLEEALEAAGYGRTGGKSGGADEPAAPWEARFHSDLHETIRRTVEESLGRAARSTERAESAARWAHRESEQAAVRTEILDRLERGELTAEQAATLLRELKHGR
jgi:hypothetical protein